MYTHLKLDLIGLHLSGDEYKHPQKIMKDLGIEYELGVPQSIADCWQFFNCSNIPDNLPNYINVFNHEPLEYIGWGLSPHEARSLTNLSDVEIEEFLNNQIEIKRKKEESLQKTYDTSQDIKHTYDPDEVKLYIGDVEVVGWSGNVIFSKNY